MTRHHSNLSNLLPEKHFPNETGPKEIFKGVWGNPARVVGPVCKEAVIGVDQEKSIETDFFVAPVDQAILGRNFINDNSVRWDRKGNVWANVQGEELVLAKNLIKENTQVGGGW